MEEGRGVVEDKGEESAEEGETLEKLDVVVLRRDVNKMELARGEGRVLGLEKEGFHRQSRPATASGRL